jgi:hypothetical protein
MTARLAKQRGAHPTFPKALPPTAVRSLFDVALENAVEGCVRETYGAVVGLVGASTVQDVELGRAMRSIASDECRHAELAWAVHAWLLPRLSADERRHVEHASGPSTPGCCLAYRPTSAATSSTRCARPLRRSPNPIRAQPRSSSPQAPPQSRRDRSVSGRRSVYFGREGIGRKTPAFYPMTWTRTLLVLPLTPIGAP